MQGISQNRRKEIIDALRRGSVPQNGLDALAVGLENFTPTLTEELNAVKAGGGKFKAIRGEYGSGKTFFGRWLQDYARRQGFATTEIQVSETETPLHKLETVYRRAMERLSTPTTQGSAFRQVIDGWIYNLEEDAISDGRVSPEDHDAFVKETDKLLEARLRPISQAVPQFGAVIRAYRQALVANDEATASGLMAWLAGQPHVAASVKKKAGVKGEVDHYAAMSFLKGMLTLLRDTGFAGLVLVLDEIETIQRTRSDVREKSLNALRQIIDEVDAGQYPGMYFLINGTAAFYEGPQGIKRLEPLAQRLAVDFQPDPKFDNPRAVQIRLQGFSLEKLVSVGMKVREIFLADAKSKDRVTKIADESYVTDLANAVAGKFGAEVSIAPRIFLKKLVDVLDKIDLFEEFNPRKDYQLTLAETELSTSEKAAVGLSVDDIEIDV